MSEKDLVHHYKVLKQFLDISDDQQTRSKSNSSRAQRAREKLLKLSSAQFKELSTDVYDELKRRIDESRKEPDYLLPKSSFHPKRNQARQKLASLPQTRFKDLVADISFEIERRELHIDHQQINHSKQPSITSSTHTRQQSLSSHHTLSTLNRGDSNNQLSSSKNITSPADVSNQSIGIQPSEVVPTKANLTWSSDEEEEEEEEEEDVEEKQGNLQHQEEDNQFRLQSPPPPQSQINRGIAPDVDHDELNNLKDTITQFESENNELKQRCRKYQLENEELEEKVFAFKQTLDSTMQQNSHLNEKIKSLEDEHSSLMEKHQSMSKSINESSPNELQRIKSINAQLRLENQSLKNSSGNKSPTSKNHTSQSKIDELLNKLEESKSTSTNKASTKISILQEQVKLYQRRYETLSSQKTVKNIKSMAKIDSLNKYISSTGLISIKLVSDLQAMVDTFLSIIDQTEIDTDVVFDKISKIAVVGNEIANQGDSDMKNNEYSIVLREAIAYALTSVRYYATYHSMYPKYVVEKALGELFCCVCELISHVKLNDNSVNTRDIFVMRHEANNHIKQEKKVNEAPIRPFRIKNDEDKGLRLKSSTSPSEKSRSSKEFSPENKVNYHSDSPKNSPYKETPMKSPSRIMERIKTFEQNSPTSSQNSPPEKLSGPFQVISSMKSTVSPSNKAEPRQLNFNIPEQSHDQRQLINEPRQLNNEPRQLNNEPRQFNQEPRQFNQEPRQFNQEPRQLNQDKNSNLESRQLHVKNDAFNQSDDKQELSQIKALRENKDEPRQFFNSNGTTAGKGLFQSLKDRLVGESEPTYNSNSDDTVSDHEKSIEKINTAETTPSNEPPHNESIPKQNSDDLNDSLDNSNNTIVSVKKTPELSSKPRVTISEPQYDSNSDYEDTDSEEDQEETKARQRQEYRKSMAAATFNVDLFDIDDPDNTLTQVLLYLEHQTVEVINTIQSLLAAIKKPNATRGDLREKSKAITVVISQMTEATNTSMNQTRNAQLKEHGSWVVKSLADCEHRMDNLCKPNDKSDGEFADKNFKQRLAGISFDIAKCTKELVKTVEEASLKEDIAYLDARLSQQDDLT